MGNWTTPEQGRVYMRTYIGEYRRKRMEAEPGWKPAHTRSPQHVRNAQEAVRRAIRSGKLVRPDTCSKCGVTDVPIEAAHHSYEPEFRLDVRWLCRQCHRREDSEAPKAQAS